MNKSAYLTSLNLAHAAVSRGPLDKGSRQEAGSKFGKDGGAHVARVDAWFLENYAQLSPSASGMPAIILSHARKATRRRLQGTIAAVLIPGSSSKCFAQQQYNWRSSGDGDDLEFPESIGGSAILLPPKFSSNSFSASPSA